MSGQRFRRRYCSVNECKNDNSSTNITLHYFPKNADLKEKWTVKLNMFKKPVKKFMKVCSDHFEERDYTNIHIKQRKRLKRNAVPSKKLPVERDYPVESCELLASKKKASFSGQQAIANAAISPALTSPNRDIVDLLPENDSAECNAARTRAFVKKCIIRIDLLAAQFFMPKFSPNI